LPKGKKRKEESQTPRRNRPSAPILRKKAKTARPQVEEIKSIRVRNVTTRTSNSVCEHGKGAHVLIIGQRYQAIDLSRPNYRQTARQFGIFGNPRIAALYGVTNVLPVTIIVGCQGRLEGRIDGVTDIEEVKKFLQ
jgi:hypothetical protein